MKHIWKKETFIKACDRLNELGFQVYAKPATTIWRNVTHGYYTDGKRIAYFQATEYGDGIKISTVHIPNRNTGTGFGIYGHIDPENMRESDALAGFTMYPSWALQGDRESVKKYRDFDDFKSRSLYGEKLTLLTRDNRDILESTQ